MKERLGKVIATGILVWLCVSCKRPEGAATMPAAGSPAQSSTAPTAAPASASITIAGKGHLFASPAISLDKSSTPRQLILYSSDDAHSGGFYFEVPLEDDWSEGKTVAWEEERRPTGDEESMVGIHLPGRALLPAKIRIVIRPLNSTVAQVDLAGDFAVQIDDAPVLGTNVHIEASFPAAIEQ